MSRELSEKELGKVVGGVNMRARATIDLNPKVDVLGAEAYVAAMDIAEVMRGNDKMVTKRAAAKVEATKARR